MDVSAHLKQVEEAGYTCLEQPFDAAMIDALGTHLKTTEVNYRIETYPGTEHGFTFPLRAGKYHKPSAERHWERLLALFRRNL